MLNPIPIGLIIAASAFGGALFGFGLQHRLPKEHLGPESRETIMLGIGLVATMTALVLGLVCASAKSSFDELDARIRQSTVATLTLDRTLARYGPETAKIRAGLKEAIGHRLQTSWSSDAPSPDPVDLMLGVETLAAGIRSLTPANDSQRGLQEKALETTETLLEERWLTFGHLGDSIPTPFLVVIAFWLAMTFLSFSLFAPRNGTVVAVLAVCALSVGSAVFLILEMDGPFTGMITVSSAPVEYVYERLGR